MKQFLHLLCVLKVMSRTLFQLIWDLSASNRTRVRNYCCKCLGLCNLGAIFSLLVPPIAVSQRDHFFWRLSEIANHVQKCYEHSVLLGRLGKQTYYVAITTKWPVKSYVARTALKSLQLVANSRAWLFKIKLPPPQSVPHLLSCPLHRTQVWQHCQEEFWSLSRVRKYCCKCLG